MTNPSARRSFRLPHETHDAPTTARPRPRIRTTAHAGHDDCAVSDVAARRRSAHRTVASLTTGIAVATGLGALGMGWMAQQATAATSGAANADSSVVDQVTTDPSADPTALVTPPASTKAATKAKAKSKSHPSSTRTAPVRTTTVHAAPTRTQPPVVRVTAPAPAPVHAGTHSS